VTALARQLGFSALAGACSAIAHFGTLIALVEMAGIDPVPASAASFVVGGLVNYAINYRLTFRSDARHRVALPRFFAVAAMGLALNTALMWLLVKPFGVQYVVAQIVTTIVTFFFHFAVNKAWTFRRRGDGAKPPT
jgi:putative flippase GtrA